MKRQTIVLLCASSLLSFGACTSYSQSAKVPSVVLNALNTAHPGAANVDWDKVRGGYEAEFGPQDAEVTVRLDGSGKVLRQKTEIAATALPTAIQTKVKAGYPSGAISDPSKVEEGGRTYYQLEVEQAGKRDIKLVMDAEGKTRSGARYWD